MDGLKRAVAVLAMLAVAACGEQAEDVGISGLRPDLGVESAEPATLEIRVHTDAPGEHTFFFTGDVEGHPYMYPSTANGPENVFDTYHGTYTIESGHDPDFWFPIVGGCWDGESSVDQFTFETTILLAAGEHLICEYTFEQRRGTIQLRKTVAAGPYDSFDFGWSGGSASGSGEQTVDFQLEDGELSQVFDVIPGSYSFWEVLNGVDWQVTSIECTGGREDGHWVDLGAGNVAVDLEGGEAVVCEFTNTYQPGTIIIEYESSPEGGSAEIQHGLNGSPESFVLADGESRTFSGVAPGTHTFSSLSANHPVSAGCDDANSAGNISLINVQVDPNETVRCRFVDQLRVGTIIVRKQTIPAGGTGFTFQYPAADGSPVTESLDDGEMWSFPVPEGALAVTELVDPLYELVDVQCTGPGGFWDQESTVIYNVPAGETIDCTFINERTTGTVVVRPVSSPANATGFAFGSDLPGGTSFSLDDGQTRTFNDVPEGTYSLQQQLAAPFTVTELMCYGATPGTTTWTETASVLLDLHRGESVECVFTNTAASPPVADAGGPYTGLEGSPVTFDGSASTNPGGGALTHEWDFGDGDTSSDANPSHAYADNGVYTVSLKVVEGTTESVIATTTATISNVAPTITLLTGPPGPVPVGTSVTVEAAFMDPGVHDATWTGEMDWGDGTTSSTSSAASAPAAVSGSHVYTIPGVYAVETMAEDKDGDADTEVYEYIVVYDPSGGFVTGGGWINSPPGAFPADPTVTDKANFGFVSKYKKGANKPDGTTEFQFKAADLNFQSTEYDWLVIAGAKAQFKGSGTINGIAGFGFLLKAIDGGAEGGDGVDRFRIKIWDVNSEVVVYDNQIGADDGADPTTALGGGSIVVHSGKKK